MLLKSVKYKDFRCFKGEVEFDLSCETDKNIIVILGDNTHGKSTIVQSFVWCFYGVSNFQNPEIYNRNIATDLQVLEKTTPTVEVVFEHEQRLYTARRKQEFIKVKDGRVVPSGSGSSNFTMTYVDPESGQTKPCGIMANELSKAINNILPKDLAGYFFFAGEKDNELTTKSLSSAVRNLLGIEALLKMRDHMHGNTKDVSAKSVLGYYKEKQVDEDNDKAKTEWVKRVQAEENLTKVEKRLDEIANQICEYEGKINTINQILREAAPTKAIQKRRDTIVRDLKWEADNLEKFYSEYLSDFNDKAAEMFTYPLLNKANEKLEKMDLNDKGVKGLEVSAIKELLLRGICLCGTDLKEGTVAYKNVEKYIDILPPKAVGTLVRQLQDTMVQSEYNAKRYVKKAIDKYKDIQFCIDKIHQLEREEQEAISELKAIGNVYTEQYEIDLIQYKKRIEQLRNEERVAIANRQTYSNQIETATKNFNMYQSKSKRNADYALYYAYAKEIFNWISDTYDKKEADIRHMLEESVSRVFNNIYAGKRKVTIDSNYNITINPPADTGGIKAIQYFSYIGGLVEVARVVMKQRKETEMFGEEYPLVLDAAFSHTDANHTKAIAIELAKVTNQLIFAVMDKDWEHVANEINGKISKTYKLTKLNESEVSIQEV